MSDREENRLVLKKVFLCPNGFTLIEILISLGIFAIVGVGITVVLTLQQKSARDLEKSSSKLTLTRSLNRAIRNTNALYKSATVSSSTPNNQGSLFDYCMNGTGGATGCHATDSVGGDPKIYPFYLFSNVAGETTPIAGPDMTVFYDKEGKICAALSANCSIVSTATFSAYCAGGAKDCPKAESIRFAFRLEEKPFSTFRPVTGSYSLPLGNIMNGASPVPSTPGHIPYWNASAVLSDSMIVQGLPGADIGFTAPKTTVFGNTNFRQILPPVRAMNVAGDAVFYKDLQIGGVVTVHLNIVGSNTSMTSRLSATGQAFVGSTPFTNANVWTGSLHVAQDFTCTVSITAPLFFTLSDERFKENIRSLGDVRERLLKLRGVHFQWLANNKIDDGFIAQDVQKVFPELVGKDSSGYLTVSYLNLVAPLSQSIKLDHQDREKRDLQAGNRLQLLHERLARLQKSH